MAQKKGVFSAGPIRQQLAPMLKETSDAVATAAADAALRATSDHHQRGQRFSPTPQPQPEPEPEPEPLQLSPMGSPAAGGVNANGKPLPPVRPGFSPLPAANAAAGGGGVPSPQTPQVITTAAATGGGGGRGAEGGSGGGVARSGLEAHKQKRVLSGSLTPRLLAHAQQAHAAR
jgi:hypothetical protein